MMSDKIDVAFATTLADLRYAWRTLRRRPTFFAVAVASVALAISLNTTMYSEVDAILAPVIDIRAPHELATIIFHSKRKSRVDREVVWQAASSALRDERGVSGSSAGAVL